MNRSVLILCDRCILCGNTKGYCVLSKVGRKLPNGSCHCAFLACAGQSFPVWLFPGLHGTQPRLKLFDKQGPSLLGRRFIDEKVINLIVSINKNPLYLDQNNLNNKQYPKKKIYIYI
ncbi:hypothetical protein CEXT_637641 [Caerostris extrusa]|uniref:Uncharacterized protein n=1 Tax=Caerostris extrusa TaxID=172846 RepID=A0AAV4MI61_CAEEX|nr:hypothetical protein CEXT_637641 [Caerostris extrusa]